MFIQYRGLCVLQRGHERITGNMEEREKGEKLKKKKKKLVSAHLCAVQPSRGPTEFKHAFM
jgi:hypothetical protein